MATTISCTRKVPLFHKSFVTKFTCKRRNTMSCLIDSIKNNNFSNTQNRSFSVSSTYFAKDTTRMTTMFSEPLNSNRPSSFDAEKTFLHTSLTPKSSFSNHPFNNNLNDVNNEEINKPVNIFKDLELSISEESLYNDNDIEFYADRQDGFVKLDGVEIISENALELEVSLHEQQDAILASLFLNGTVVSPVESNTSFLRNSHQQQQQNLGSHGQEEYNLMEKDQDIENTEFRLRDEMNHTNSNNYSAPSSNLTAIHPTEIIDPAVQNYVNTNINNGQNGMIIGEDNHHTHQIILDEVPAVQEIIQAATRVTKRSNTQVIRRRKMNIHKYKKRRRKYRRDTRLHKSDRRRMRIVVLKEKEQIEKLKEYFTDLAKDAARKKRMGND